jgi:ankyrin repeat protein
MLTNQTLSISEEQLINFLQENNSRSEQFHDEDFITLIKQFIVEKENDPEKANNLVSEIITYSYNYFISCVHAGACEAVYYLINTLKADVNQTESYSGRTGLMIASLYGYMDMAELLLAQGASPHIVTQKKGYENATALHYCAEGRTLDCAKIAILLLEKGCDPHLKRSHIHWGGTFLDVAIGVNRLDRLAFVKAILPYLKLEADIRKAKAYLDNALHLANQKLLEGAKTGNIQQMKQALQEGADIEAHQLQSQEIAQYNALNLATLSGNKEAVLFLLSNGADIEGRNLSFKGTSLHHAAQVGKIETMKILLEHKADKEALDHTCMTPLHYTVYYNQPEVARALIRAGANLEAVTGEYHAKYHNQLTPLAMAKAIHHDTGTFNNHDRSEIIEILETAPYLNNMLLNAVKKGDAEATRSALEQGANPNLKDMNCNNGSNATVCYALHHAVYSRNAECVRVLLEAGADVDVYTDKQDAPLHWAACNNTGDSHNTIITMLMNKNAMLTLNHAGHYPINSSVWSALYSDKVDDPITAPGAMMVIAQLLNRLQELEMENQQLKDLQQQVEQLNMMKNQLQYLENMQELRELTETENIHFMELPDRINELSAKIRHRTALLHEPATQLGENSRKDTVQTSTSANRSGMFFHPAQYGNQQFKISESNPFKRFKL